MANSLVYIREETLEGYENTSRGSLAEMRTDSGNYRAAQADRTTLRRGLDPTEQDLGGDGVHKVATWFPLLRGEILESPASTRRMSRDSAQPSGQTTNHSVDWRRYCLIPSPVQQGRKEDDQKDPTGCDKTCADRMTFEKCRLKHTNSSRT